MDDSKKNVLIQMADMVSGKSIERGKYLLFKQLTMKLIDKERDELWGEVGPYSEVNITMQERILDDKISRTFVEVTVNINPFTFRLIKKNRNEFIGDEMIQQLLDHSDWRGQKFGYVSCAFSRQYNGEEDLEEAKKHLKYATQTVIKMHQYVIKIISNLEVF